MDGIPALTLWCLVTDLGLTQLNRRPALDLWHLVIEVFHSSTNQFKKIQRQSTGNLVAEHPIKQAHHLQTKTPSQHDNLELRNVDYVTSNAKSSQFVCDAAAFLRTTKQ